MKIIQPCDKTAQRGHNTARRPRPAKLFSGFRVVVWVEKGAWRGWGLADNRPASVKKNIGHHLKALRLVWKWHGDARRPTGSGRRADSFVVTNLGYSFGAPCCASQRIHYRTGSRPTCRIYPPIILRRDIRVNRTSHHGYFK